MEMKITPRNGLGPFQLGACIADVIFYLKRNGMAYREVTVLFSNDNPFGSDVGLCLHDCGTKLWFEPGSQRLRVIELFDLTRTNLSYNNSVFSGVGAQGEPSFKTIYHVFGPTFPGRRNESTGVYELRYPGVCFMFPLTPKDVGQLVGGEEQWFTQMNEKGSELLAHRVMLHDGEGVGDPRLSPAPPQPEWDLYYEPVVAYVQKGLLFTKRKKFIGFNSRAQDCLADLGPAEAVCVKEDDIMAIHNGRQRGALCESWENNNDYFFNYFSLGVDFLLDGHTHRVKKIVLHCNAVMHPDFNRYRKCRFIVSRNSKEQEGDDILAAVANTRRLSDNNSSALQSSEPPRFSILQTIRASQSSMAPAPAPDAPSQTTKTLEQAAEPTATTPELNSDSKWCEYEAVFGKEGQPMIHGAGKQETVLGPTFFHAYEGVIFQVMKNGYLAGLTLFH